MALSWWEKGLWQICMHHWTVHAKVEFLKFPPHVRSWGGESIPQLLILNWEMKHLHWYLLWVSCNIKHITAISNLHYQRKNSKLAFSNGPQLMGKGLWQICMHHWTVHAKVEFLKFSTRCQIWGVHSTTFDPELRNEFKKHFHQMSDPGLGGPFHNFWSWTEEWNITLISFMGFPAILSTLQPFQICIFNRENSKLTFSNGPQLMGKRFIADLHASLDSTCKSRISKISTRCQIWGGGPFHNFWSWTEKWI